MESITGRILIRLDHNDVHVLLLVVLWFLVWTGRVIVIVMTVIVIVTKLICRKATGTLSQTTSLHGPCREIRRNAHKYLI